MSETFEHPSWQRAHAEAMSAIRRGASIALFGLPGSGKTLLLECLAGSLRSIGVEVGLSRPPARNNGGASEVILVDEADTLSESELRHLCEGDAVLGIAGLPDFAGRVSMLPRRIVAITLEPVSAESVARFVASRLRQLGHPATLFTPEAVLSVAEHSAGLMRLVVVLSGSAMFLAEQEGAPNVTARHVEEATALRFNPEVSGPIAPATPEPEQVATNGHGLPKSTRRISPVLVGVAAAVLAGVGLCASLQPNGPEPQTPSMVTSVNPASQIETNAERHSAVKSPEELPDPRPDSAAENVPPASALAAKPLPIRPLSEPRFSLNSAVADRFTLFSGPVMNVTMQQGGQLTLMIQRQEGQNVTIDFRASSGLIGTGRLAGTMTEDGHITVDGRLMMGRNPFHCEMNAFAVGDSLTGEASFTRIGANSSARSTFTLARRS